MVFEGYGCKTPELCLLSYPTKDKETACNQCSLRYQKKTMIMSADDILESIQLYCEKHNIDYDSEIICWKINELDMENEGNTSSSFQIQLFEDNTWFFSFFIV